MKPSNRLRLWRLTGFIAVSILSACAGQAVPISKAPNVPPERILDRQAASTFDGAVKVTIIRDHGGGGHFCTKRILVDLKPVADIDDSEKIVIYLKEGKHTLSIFHNAPCVAEAAEVDFIAVSGVEMTYRVGTAARGMSSAVNTISLVPN